MKVLMKIENGKLIPPAHIQLVADQGEVMVDLPTAVIRQASSQVRQQLDDLLGRYARPRPSVTADEDKRFWHEHLEEKHLP